MTYRIGVIGVGIIGEPLVRGLIRALGTDVELHLSPRNAGRAANLAAELPQVLVEPTSQEVVDNSDWVVLAVLVPVAEQVTRALRFRPDQHLVSLLAGVDIASLREWSGLESITRMVPLPYVAQGAGPVASYPVTPELQEVFGGLGTLVPASDETELATMSMITSTQSAFFAVLAEVVGWAQHRALSPERAQEFAIAFYSALLAKAATLSPADLADHWQEMTPGGLNHTATTAFTDHGGVRSWSVALDAVHARR